MGAIKFGCPDCASSGAVMTATATIAPVKLSAAMQQREDQDMTTPDQTGALANARLAFIGAGVMGEAMIAGLLNRGLVAVSQIVASHPRADRRERLVSRFGIDTAESNRDAAEGADLVFLTVKPQVLGSVMKQLHGRLNAEQVAVSVIAGASIRALSNGLGHDAIARVMPNTPAQIGQGMMVWTSTA